MSKLSHVAKRRQLDRPISGKGGYLDLGTHEVVIDDVDISQVLDDPARVKVTFKDCTGATHREMIWLITKYGDDYSSVLINFINSMFQDPSVFDVLDTAFSNENVQEMVFKSFAGLRLRIGVDRTPGYVLATYNGRVVIEDAETGQPLDSREFRTIAEARSAAVAKKLKQSWKRVTNYEGLDHDVLADNHKKFHAAIASIEESSKLFGNLGQIFSGSIFSSVTKGG